MGTQMQIRCMWIAGLVVATSAACDTSTPGALGDGAPATPGTTTNHGGGGLAPGSNGGANGGSGDGPGGVSSAPHLPCDVDAVLGASCRSCHGATTAYGAPESLVTYADLMAPAKADPSKKVYELLGPRIHATSNPMPPGPAAPLSAAEAATIDAWVTAGAPSSTQVCDPAGQGDAGSLDPDPLPCTPDTHIRPPAPFAVDATKTDEYVCYGFDVSPAQKRHVIGLGPRIDNKAVVHHLLLFQSATAYSSTPTPCQAFGSAQWTLITGWAPGGQPFMMPPEAGFPEEGTTHWILQVHYNNSKGVTGQTDSSGYDLCTTDKLRPNDADVMAVGSVNFSIPPHATVDLSCNYTHGLGPIHVFGASPHMHLLGKSMLSTNTTKAATIVDRPFDFQSQIGVATSVDIASGDAINTHCVWQNSTGNTVSFGENTGDEMCFGFLQYYPKIVAPLWSWTTPSVLASCTSTTK